MSIEQAILLANGADIEEFITTDKTNTSHEEFKVKRKIVIIVVTYCSLIFKNSKYIAIPVTGDMRFLNEFHNGMYGDIIAEVIESGREINKEIEL